MKMNTVSFGFGVCNTSADNLIPRISLLPVLDSGNEVETSATFQTAKDYVRLAN